MKKPETAMILGANDFGGDSLALRLLNAYEKNKDEYILGTGNPEIHIGHTNNMAVRRELFEKVGTFIEMGRGADTIFAQRCMSAFGCRIFRYCPSVRVKHMEINRVRQYFRKVAIYGDSINNYGKHVRVRALTDKERCQVLFRTIRTQGYSMIKSFLLICLLLLGRIYWAKGRMGWS